MNIIGKEGNYGAPVCPFFCWPGPGPGRFFLMKPVAACGGDLTCHMAPWPILDGAWTASKESSVVS